MVTATFGSVGKNDTKAPIFYKENQGKIKKIKSLRNNLEIFQTYFFSE